MKIIALLPVKNEGWCLEHCLKSLCFVDEILAINDNSIDSTLELLQKYNCTIVPFETKTQTGWKEFDIRTKLLEEARLRKATHIIALDGDEACSEKLQEDIIELLSQLKPGQSLTLEWLNLCSKTHFKKPRIFKEFAFCDDGKSTFTNNFLGVSRVPELKIETLKIDRPGLCIFHYQYLNKRRLQYKQAWYMMSEFLNKKRSAQKINNTYKQAQSFTCLEIKENQTSPITVPNPDDDTIEWQRQEILKMFNEHSPTFFELLDIWHIKELEDIFIKETGRKPKPKLFPKWLIILNNFKNKCLK